MCFITSAIASGIAETQGKQLELEDQRAEAEHYAAQEAENARLARREAEAIGVMGYQEEQQLRAKMLSQKSASRAGYAASGVVLGSGTSADYEADIADAYGVDAENLRYDIESRQWQKRVAAVNHSDQSAMYRRKAQSLEKQKDVSLLGGVFGTIGGAAQGAVTDFKILKAIV